MVNSAPSWFGDATDGVLALVAAIPDAAWDGPGLGGWTLRELVAHTGRSWSLVTTYLDAPAPDPAASVGTAASYLALGLTQPGIHEGVLQRGRDDAPRLGADPLALLRRHADAALAAVESTPSERIIPTRICPLPLAEFVRTRAFELTVHGLDIARAAHLEVPDVLTRAMVPALKLLADVAGERDMALDLLLAATGRGTLAPGFTLLA